MSTSLTVLVVPAVVPRGRTGRALRDSSSGAHAFERLGAFAERLGLPGR